MNEKEFSKFKADFVEVGSMNSDKSDRSPPESAADQTDESTDLKQLFGLSKSIKDVLVECSSDGSGRCRILAVHRRRRLARASES